MRRSPSMPINSSRCASSTKKVEHWVLISGCQAFLVGFEVELTAKLQPVAVECRVFPVLLDDPDGARLLAAIAAGEGVIDQVDKGREALDLMGLEPAGEQGTG